MVRGLHVETRNLMWQIWIKRETTKELMKIAFQREGTKFCCDGATSENDNQIEFHFTPYNKKGKPMTGDVDTLQSFMEDLGYLSVSCSDQKQNQELSTLFSREGSDAQIIVYEPVPALFQFPVARNIPATKVLSELRQGCFASIQTPPLSPREMYFYDSHIKDPLDYFPGCMRRIVCQIPRLHHEWNNLITQIAGESRVVGTILGKLAAMDQLFAFFRQQDSTPLQSHLLLFNSFSIASHLILDIILGSLLLFSPIRSVIESCISNLVLWGEDSFSIQERVIRSLFHNPMGYKVNGHLSGFIGSFLLSLTYFWSALVVPITFEFLRPSGKYLYCLSLLGISVSMSLVSDACRFLTFQIYFSYRKISRFFNIYTSFVASVFNLFRGKRWNVLRQRVDNIPRANQVNRQLLGSVLFISLVMLFPTISSYYVTLCGLHFLVLMVREALDLLIKLASKFPLLEAYLYWRGLLRFCQGFKIKLLSADSEKHPMEVTIIPEWPPNVQELDTHRPLPLFGIEAPRPPVAEERYTTKHVSKTELPTPPHALNISSIILLSPKEISLWG